jgi:hypothetical protein
LTGFGLNDIGLDINHKPCLNPIPKDGKGFPTFSGVNLAFFRLLVRKIFKNDW